MVIKEPLKPSIFFTDITYGGERKVHQYEDAGFLWIITVENGELVRKKARGQWMTRLQALNHKPNPFDEHWRQVTEQEAIAWLFPDTPTSMEDAW